MKKTDAKTVAKKAGNVLTIAALVFIFYKLLHMDVDITVYNDPMRVAAALVLGVVVVVLGIVLMAFAWRDMLQVFAGKRIGFRDAYGIYAKANVGKYLPGNVMHFVERNLFAAGHGIGQVETLTSTISEIIGQAAAAAVLSLVLAGSALTQFVGQHVSWRMYIVAASLLIAVIAVAIALNKKSEKFHRVFLAMRTRGFAGAFLRNIAMYLVYFLLNGLTILLSLWAMGATWKASELPVLFAMNAAAWLIGFVIPGVPGGIGVRELVLSTMAAGTSVGDVVLVAAVGQRVVLILGDFAAYLLGLIIARSWDDRRPDHVEAD